MELLKVNKESNLIEASIAGEVIVTSVGEPREWKGTNVVDISLLNEGKVQRISVKADKCVGLKVGPAMVEQTAWKANTKLGYAASVSTKIGNL